MFTTRGRALDLSLGQVRQVGDLGRREQRGRRVLAGRDAGAAADALRGVERQLGRRPWGSGRALPSGAPPDVHRRVAAGLDDPVERAAIDDQVLDDREGARRATARA